MTRRGLIGWLGGAAATLALAACSNSTTASYRFRITVEVRTPQGTKTASSVMEEVASRETFMTSETGKGKGALRGEAVVIDLPEGPLFVLLELPHARGSLGGYVTQTLSGGKDFTGFDDLFAAVRRLGRWFSTAKAELPREDWPLMVRFGDLNNPKTVEEVDPDAVGVKSIVVETTSSEVTSGIQSRLPWLKNEGQTLDPAAGPTFSQTPPLAQVLRQRMFKAGE